MKKWSKILSSLRFDNYLPKPKLSSVRSANKDEHLLREDKIRFIAAYLLVNNDVDDNYQLPTVLPEDFGALSQSVHIPPRPIGFFGRSRLRRRSRRESLLQGNRLPLQSTESS
jgi:hypothetical protein